jgi:hypothetical protein
MPVLSCFVVENWVEHFGVIVFLHCIFYSQVVLDLNYALNAADEKTL